MARVLLAGASGSLGQEILRSLAERGHWVRTLSRGPRSAAMLFTGEHVRADLTHPDSLTGTCQGVDLVFSSAGSSMHLDDFRDRRRYLDVDFTGNRNLLREAEREGTPRFVYVSLHGGEKLRHNSYADAHERFVDALNASPVSSLVIRPTGFFSFLLQILRMAKRRRGVVIGDGSARANPIHQADLGDFSVDHLESERGGAVGRRTGSLQPTRHRRARSSRRRTTGAGSLSAGVGGTGGGHSSPTPESTHRHSDGVWRGSERDGRGGARLWEPPSE